MVWEYYQVTSPWFKTKHFVIFLIIKTNTAFFVRFGFWNLKVVNRIDDAGTHMVMDTTTIEIPVCKVCPARAFVVF
jgi:hypothetical protein